MQSVSSRVWTRVTVSISYDDNHYTTKVIIAMFYSSQSSEVLSAVNGFKYCYVALTIQLNIGYLFTTVK